MEYYNNFYEEKKLNIKKVVICVAAGLFLLIIIIALLKTRKPQNNADNTVVAGNVIEHSTTNNHNNIYQDENKTISVELKKSYKLQYAPLENERILVLKSEDNLSVYISKMDLVQDHDLLEIVSHDQQFYIEKVGKHSNVTEIRELQVGSLRAYTYGLHYLDESSNTAYLLQVVWLESPDGYYIFDVDYPLSDDVYYQSLMRDILSTFSIESLKQHVEENSPEEMPPE